MILIYMLLFGPLLRVRVPQQQILCLVPLEDLLVKLLDQIIL